MEVSGRRLIRSDETHTGHLCDPCNSAGETVNAESYCVDCHEFLCLTCAKVHTRQAISKGHQLLGRDQMPKMRVTTPSENTCRKHEGKPYDFFCKNHDVLCCSVCLTIDHKQCAAEYITDLVERFERSGEYEALQFKMTNLDVLIGETKTATDSNMSTSKRSADQLIFEIEKFRREINTYLDSLEKDLLDQVRAIKVEDFQAMSTVLEELETMKAELDALTAKLEGLSALNRKKELVIASTLADKDVITITNRIGKLGEQNHVRHFRFRRSDKILDMLQSTDFGMLGESKMSDKEPVTQKKIDSVVTQPHSYNVKYENDIDLKHTEDLSDCNVTGSVLMDSGRLAVADSSNRSVKIVGIDQGKVLYYTKLSSYPPWDITYTNQNELVVTSPGEQKLIFLVVSKILYVSKELEVDGPCRYIDYNDNRLIVSFRKPASVKILNMDGHVLSSMSNEPNCIPPFSWPEYVISSTDSSAIYVSDWNQHNVTKIDMKGRVIYRYSSNECRGPRDIAIDQYGNLFVAGEDSSIVCILSAEGRHISTIEAEGPRSVVLSEHTNQLFVSHGYGSSSCNYLSSFKLR